jgi:recombination protein RecT
MGQLTKMTSGALSDIAHQDWVKQQVLAPVARIIKPMFADDQDLVRFAAQFARTVLTNPDLLKCDPVSLQVAAVDLVHVGLELKLGEAWLIPRYDKDLKCHVCSMQVGWRGALKLAYETGIVKAVRMGTLDENYLEFDVDEVNGVIVHRKALTGMPGKALGYYAVVDTTDGARFIRYMTAEEVEDHRKRYRGDGPAWRGSYDRMAEKTVLLQVLRNLPKHKMVERIFAYENGGDRKSLAEVPGAERFARDGDDGVYEEMAASVAPHAEEAEVVQRSPGSAPDPAG